MFLLDWNGDRQIFLLGVVVCGQHAELFIAHPSQNIVFVETLEQRGQLIVSPMHGIQFPLQAVNFPAQFCGVPLVDVLGKLPLLHPCEVRDPAQVIQHNGFQVRLTDLMR